MTKQENAAIVVVSIMLALIVKAALEATFKPIFDDDLAWSTITLLSWVQVSVFFVMMLRFYLGAIRYINSEPENLDFLVRAVNFVFAFMLFCAFYVTALSVMDSAYFYTLIVAVHIFDAAWFVVAISLMKLRDAEDISGQIRSTATYRVMFIFLVFSTFTILYGLLSYPLIFNETIYASEPIWAHWAFLGVLTIISLLDFWALFEYYFQLAKWREKNIVPPV
jgi:hypothetical protein